MSESMLQYLNFTQLLVVLTLIHAGLNYNPKNKDHIILLAILLLSFETELLSFIFLVNQIPTNLLMTLNVIAHNGLWLWIISRYGRQHFIRQYALPIFLTFAATNFFFIEGFQMFNFNTFIVSALLYIAIFIHESFYRLQQEDLSFFTCNKFLLVFSPVLLFLGLTFIFAFQSIPLASTVVYSNIKLYGMIQSFVNLIYYLLLNFYIHREKQVRHAY